jgi:hypothetical protein
MVSSEKTTPISARIRAETIKKFMGGDKNLGLYFFFF